MNLFPTISAISGITTVHTTIPKLSYNPPYYPHYFQCFYSMV